jgi:GNAT superfamily N-acetyltransferase
MLPSFDHHWHGNAACKPKILILAVKDRLDQTPMPFIHLAVERTHTSDETKSSLVLKYCVIDRHDSNSSVGGFFSASYCALSNKLSLTGGAVFLDPGYIQGQRVGTYLMNEIVTWARQWPMAMVNPICLSEAQASPDNRARRNWFYEQFGIVFIYHDPECRAGLSQVMPVGALKTVTTWMQNIEEIPVPKFLSKLLGDNRHLSLELHARDSANEYLRNELRQAEASPWLWAGRTWVHKHLARIMLTAVFLAIGFVAYFQYVGRVA